MSDQTSAGKSEGPVCPESTIESSHRRDFIRKAALVTAAAGVGATLLGKSLIPESSASSNGVDCDYEARVDLVADLCGNNNGTNVQPGLLFGGLAGEGIASARTCGSPNRFGLDFYTSFTKRASITNCGKTEANNSLIVDALHNNSGTSVCPGIIFAGGTGEGIASNRNCAGSVPNVFGLDFYTGGSKRVSITNNGQMGIGTDSPSCFSSSILFVKGGVGVPAIAGSSCTSTGVSGVSCGGTGVSGTTSLSGTGVEGFAECGIGVNATSLSGPGIQALSGGSLVGKFKNNAFSGDRTVPVQLEPGDTTIIDWNIGVAGAGNNLTISDGDFYVEQLGKGARMVIDTSGNVGIGANKPKTSLQVNGSFSAKVVTKTASYAMKGSDFAVFASGSGTTITLPPAKTASGMVVFLKNVNTTAVAVTVKPAGTDKIDGTTSQSLPIAYSPLTLISDGVSNWFILSKS